MNNQLGLSIVPRLQYKRDNFILHSGVKELIRATLSLNSRINNSIFIDGKQRSGKTHLSIYLAEEYSKLGSYVNLLEGAELSSWLTQRLLTEGSNKNIFTAKDVFIIDNMQDYLEQPSMQNSDLADSGNYVAFFEAIKKSNGLIIMLSRSHVSNVSSDPHIMSRLRSSASFSIQDPEENDMYRLIAGFASQRGIKLTEKKLNFLTKRLSRNIGEIEEYFDRLHKVMSARSERLGFSLLGDAV